MLSKILLVFVIFLAVSSRVTAQIVINEVSAAQNMGYGDEDGDFPDWIELYNAGALDVDLAGYSLTRIEDDNIKWTFPSVIIPANDHLVVFASEKDRRIVIDHWEIPSHPGVLWSYYTPGLAPVSNWNEISFSDATWSIGLPGIGYGDGDDVTIIPTATTLYMRSAFTIADTSKISIGLVAIDYDDSFVAYFNGVEVARNNVGVAGIPPAFDELAYDEHEAKIYTGGGLEYFFVDIEKMNAAKLPGNNIFAIEVHNVDPLSDDMTSIPYFVMGITNNVYTYPSFASTANLHTNFNISSFPSRLKLYDPSDELIDELILSDVQVNHSFGRNVDNGTQWCLFDTPNPDTSNVISNCYSSYTASPTFSLPAGFYNGTQSVSISSNEPGDIYYTLDGSIPNQLSNLYALPISVSNNLTIKARVFSSNPSILAGKDAVASYFIDESVSLPVFSLTTAPANLWDYNTGIYVFGPNADSINYPFIGSNFWAGWEKEAHIEYFDRQKTLGFSSDIGLKIHGNFSKAWPQKSFRILAKDDYNNKWFNYTLFPEKPYRNKFRNFNIRNAGIDYNTVHFRDALMHRATKGLNLEHMAYEPCVLFLNGQYWGVYGLRERQDESYIQENFSNVQKENIDLLRFEGDVLAGSNVGFLDMITYLETTDLSLDVNFEFVQDNLLDLENVADYFITETFYCNVDWIYSNASNNVKFWRPTNPIGKWRYILWDTDLGLGLMDPQYYLNLDFLATILSPSSTSVHSMLIKNLLVNQNYSDYFINRYADLLNTSFLPTQMEKITRELQAELQPEMARHFSKWNEGPVSFSGIQLARSTNAADWQLNIDSMIMWTNLRPQIVRNQLQSLIASPNQVDITLDVYPPEAGYIKINTVTPDSLPWMGVYFNGVPVTVTAYPNDGFVFDHWATSSLILADSSLPSFRENITINEALTAHFDPLDFNIQVYPNPSDGDFIVEYELANPTQIEIQLITVDGKLKKELVSHNTIHPEGKFSLQLNKEQSQLTSGIHYVVFKSNEHTQTIKLIIF